MIDFLRDLWSYAKEHKKIWLIPVLLTLLIIGALLVLSQGSVFAPFVYTLF